MIRAEQVDLRNYATISSVSTGDDNVMLYVNSVSGYLQDQITSNDTSTLSGFLQAQIDSNIANISGLNEELISLSGSMVSGYVAADTELSGYLESIIHTEDSNLSGFLLSQINASGGVSDHGELTGLDNDDHSAIYYNKTAINNMSGYITESIDNLTLASLSGVNLSSPTSGQLLQYNGSSWVNVSGSTSSGGSESKLISLEKSTQSITGGSWTAITWTSEEYKDSDTFTHSTSTNTSEITVLSDGIYIITSNLFIDSMSTGSINYAVYINGSNTNPGSGWQNHARNLTVNPTKVLKLSANDVISIRVYLDSTGTCRAESDAQIVKV